MVESGAISGKSEAERTPADSEIGQTAAHHGGVRQRLGFRVDQVVHDYGDLCQAVTDLSVEQNAKISAEEFRTFNRCLDNAIADAVTEYARQRERHAEAEGTAATNERLGFLAHELRNMIGAAMLAVAAIKRGNVGIAGATGAVLERSLRGLRDLVDRSLTEVRLNALQVHLEPTSIEQVFADLEIAASLDANARGITFITKAHEENLTVFADQQLLHSAVANLLQNAFKFTRPQGRVSLEARASDDRVIIEVEDECGGLPPGKAEGLFASFEQRNRDRTGVGLGLTISRRGVEACK
jgi:signal transduction histidine kinase